MINEYDEKYLICGYQCSFCRESAPVKWYPALVWTHPSLIPVSSHLSSCWWSSASETCWKGRTLSAISRGVLASFIHRRPLTNPPSFARPAPTWSSRNQPICNLPAVMNRGQPHVWLPPRAQMDDSGMLKRFLRRRWQTQGEWEQTMFLFYFILFTDDWPTIIVPVSSAGPNKWCRQTQTKHSRILHFCF